MRDLRNKCHVCTRFDNPTAWIVPWIPEKYTDDSHIRLKLLLPGRPYWPERGFVADLGLVFVISALMKAWLFRKALQWGERLVGQIAVAPEYFVGVAAHELAHFAARRPIGYDSAS